MFVRPKFPQLSLSEVFAYLNTGATVVTPNRRLALTLKHSFDTNQVRQKKTTWPSADILPFSAFIKRMYQDILFTGQTTLPTLLTADQEQVLWERVIRDSEAGQALLTTSQTAQWVREAWQLAHAWHLFPHLDQLPPNEDGIASQAWHQHFQQLTQQAGQIDTTCLIDLLSALLDQKTVPAKKPTQLICYGFDVFTPQHIAFLDKLVSADCPVTQYIGEKCHSENSQNISEKKINRVEYTNTEAEIEQAAIWARARITSNPCARIGIVVPELSTYRAMILRIFERTMLPDITLSSPESHHTPQPAVPFNISLGLPLTSYPLIDAAFIILGLIHQPTPYTHISRLLHSPFLASGEAEMQQRARLDAQLRQYAEPTITLNQLLVLIHTVMGECNCPVLVNSLSALTEFKKQLAQQHSHTEYALGITEILKAMGFPGERALNSTEYQTLKKWQSLLTEFATLDDVQSHCHYGEALSQLHRMATSTLFQPETPDVPIQILGVLEAAGMAFDHLWVMGLSDEVWPMHARINPFLPATLQRQAKLPLGSTLAASAYSAQFTQGWLSSANEVILSHPAFSDEQDGHALQPSPLIKDIELIQLKLPTYSSHLDAMMQQSNTLEKYVDNQAVPVQNSTQIKGGTHVIKDFAACPFRAWARHRLNITSLQSPHTGLNAMERGTLIHQVLAELWAQLKTKSELDSKSEAEINSILQQAADHAIQHIQHDRPTALTGSFALIEHQRLIHLALEWLDVEKKRGDFTVIAVEEKHTIDIKGLTLNTRVDRIDALENGKRIIIDYKTGQQKAAAMADEYMDEPQLPLYLITSEAKDQTIAVTFAQIRPGEMKFEAIASDSDILPGVKALAESSLRKEFTSWESLTKAWETHLEKLAIDFLAGHAEVFPKKYPATCSYCDLKPFCRIHERISAATESTE